MTLTLWFSGSLSILGDERRQALLARGRRMLAEARVQVMPILYDVRDNGDEALLRLTRRLDGVELERLSLEDWAWKRQVASVPKRDVAVLEAMARRLRRLHEAQVPAAGRVRLDGVEAGWKPVPLDRAGVYVARSQAANPAALLAGAVPAKAAGVREVIACTPPGPAGAVSPVLLAAAEVAGVDEVYFVGGAQAIFAMAFGTRSIPAVEKVVGAGNVYVQAAKQLVHGTVGTDVLAWSREVVVLADESAPPQLAAWELASQLEHDPHAVPILLATSGKVRQSVEGALEALLPKLATPDAAARALAQHGAAIDTGGLPEALALANDVAPQHLVLMVKDPRGALAKVRAAGSVHLGAHTPVALAEMGAAGSPIAPTNRNARFSSALSAADFVRRVSWQEATPAGLAKVAPHVQRMAELQGLPARAAAVGARSAKGARRPRKGARGR